MRTFHRMTIGLCVLLAVVQFAIGPVAASTIETDIDCLSLDTYSDYPMVKQARQMIKERALGKIRKIWVEYPQGWLSRKLEREGNSQAFWRTDPKKSGKNVCMSDIGTHALQLAEYVSVQIVTHVCAHLATFVENRLLEDDGNVLFRFDGGA